MWIPTPIYERIPQFWFLLGLLFIAAGLYLGSDYALIIWFGGVGFACCLYGIGVFFVRLVYRRSRQVAEPTIEQTIEQPIEQSIDPTVEQPIVSAE
jgi:hypothetical protein